MGGQEEHEQDGLTRFHCCVCLASLGSEEEMGCTEKGQGDLTGVNDSMSEQGWPLWTLNDALPLIRKITSLAKRHGFSTALYGSVLAEGQSKKDLDLYFIVAEDMTSAAHAQVCLAEVATLPEVESCPLRAGNTSTIRLRDGRQIDAQFLNYTPLSTP
jgi:hypothetical protein